LAWQEAGGSDKEGGGFGHAAPKGQLGGENRRHGRKTAKGLSRGKTSQVPCRELTLRFAFLYGVTKGEGLKADKKRVLGGA